MNDEPVKTIYLELSKTEAKLLISSLQLMKNAVADSIIATATTDRMHDFELLLAMVGRIGVTCFEVGLFDCESTFDLQRWLELRKDLEENETETETE